MLFWTTSGIKYCRITNLYPSSYITIQARFDSGSWSESVTFYILDNTSYNAEYSPPYIPPIIHQWVYDRNLYYWVGESSNCVACALSTMKNIQEHKAGVTQYREYSTGWIYGNRTSNQSQTEGMIYSEALSQLQNDGVPFFTLLTENANYFNRGYYDPDYSTHRINTYGQKYYFPDNYYYTNASPTGVTAKQLVENNRNNILSYSQPQRIASYSLYNSIFVQPIKQHIVNDGCVLITINLYDNCYPTTDGIFPQYYSGNFKDGHMMVIIGWKKINNINYWICANSWGSWTGDNGLYYFPFFADYGHVFYFVSDGSYSYPSPPSPSSAPVGTGKGNGTLSISWGSSSGLQIQGYRVKIRRGYDNYTAYQDCGDALNAILSVGCGCTYFLSVCAYDRWSNSSYTLESQDTSTPAIPVITGTASSNNSIVISISGMSGDWDTITINRYSSSGSYIDNKSINYGNASVTWNGLSGTFKFCAFSNLTVNSTLIQSTYSDLITVSTIIRPSYFYWTYSGKINSVPQYTTDSYGHIIKVQGQEFYLTKTEWDDMIQNIINIHIYKLGNYNSTSYPLTTVSLGENVLATYFNQVRYAIGSIKSTGISTKYPGDQINASDLNTLITTLNSIT